MSKVTDGQFFEIVDQVRREKIDGWACQGLIEDASEIAYRQILKKIIKEVRDSVFRADSCYEISDTLIAVAGITRDREDIRKARNSVYYHPDQFSEYERNVLLLELAVITHEPRDINPIKQVIENVGLPSYYHLAIANLLIAEMEEKKELIDVAFKEAIEEKSILRAKALSFIFLATGREDAHSGLRKILGPGEVLLVASSTNPPTPQRIDVERAYAGHYNSKGPCQTFAAIAASTRSPKDLEIAYNSVLSDRDVVDPSGALEQRWRLVIRTLYFSRADLF
ncbi:MAG: hypothetical protein WC514_01790 [Candidatus Paceibacterota bacterium]